MDPPSLHFYGQTTRDSWLLVPSTRTEKNLFQRNKHTDQSTVYHIGQTIGYGFSAVIFNLVPSEDKKFKAIKIYNQPITHKEFALIQHLNQSGPQVGIIKPAKAFFPAMTELNIPAMLIMSHYTASLAELIETQTLTELDIRSALKQISFGLIYLKENSIYHGDINLRNILYQRSGNGTRYDIADFENSLDFSSFTTLEEFQQAMSERPPIIGYFDTLILTELSNTEAVARYRELLFSHDAVSFGYLISELCSLLPNLSITKELNLLAESIKSTRSIDDILEKLDFKA